MPTNIPIGDYLVNIRTELGSGSFGTVYKGKHKDTAMLIAAKKVKIFTNNMERCLAEARAEAEAMRRVRHHPYLLHILDTVYIDEKDDEDDDSGGEQHTEFWIITEYCGLKNLNDYCQAHEVSLADKVQIARQTSAGLAFLHNLTPKVIHCDIKPGNILLNSLDGILTAKLADFGLSKNLDKSYLSSFRGTLRFIAPELWLVEQEGGCYLRFGPPSDVYSLGIVQGMLLEAKSQQPLHNPEAASRMVGRDMMRALTRDDVAMPEVVTVLSTDPPVPRRWKTIILRMTAVDPKDRPPMSEVEQLLLALQQDLPRAEGATSAEAEVEQLRREVQLLRAQQPKSTIGSTGAAGGASAETAKSVQPAPQAAESVQPAPQAAESVQPAPQAAKSVQPAPQAAKSVQPAPQAAKSARPQAASPTTENVPAKPTLTASPHASHGSYSVKDVNCTVHLCEYEAGDEGDKVKEIGADALVWTKAPGRTPRSLPTGVDLVLVDDINWSATVRGVEDAERRGHRSVAVWQWPVGNDTSITTLADHAASRRHHAAAHIWLLRSNTYCLSWWQDQLSHDPRYQRLE